MSDATGWFALALGEAEATRPDLTGGKGANLARMIAADLPVPPGVCVTTAAYRVIVDAPAIERAIESLDALDPDDADAVVEASATIRSEIRRREVPEAVRRAVANALEAIDADAYAVRSSATAEDLPTASFAGQHESYLGVEPSAVLDRVRDCVAGLFTDRAVAYRLRDGVAHGDVAMAVVVQPTVDADVAGVLFTADPVSGNRHVASVDANYGLGETVVAGEVSPDNARVDRRTGEILAYEVGEKDHALRAGADGTEAVAVSRAEREARALSDAQLRDLVALGDRIEALFGAPQDVEWALVDGSFVLLQSRPITSLFPLPSPSPDDDHRHVYFSMGHQQAMPAALPPLVVDWLRAMANGAVDRVRPRPHGAPLAVEAGHRVYVDLTPLLGYGPTRRVVLRVLDSMSEPAARAVEELLEEGRIHSAGPVAGARRTARVARRALPLVASAAPTVLARFLRPFLLGPADPERVREAVEREGRRLTTRVSRPPSQAEQVRAALEEVDLGSIAARIGSRSMPLFLAGLAAGRVLERLFPDAGDELDALASGFEHEIATQVNQRLGDLADVARRHPDVADALATGDSLSEVERVDGGRAFLDAFEAFLEAFGHRASSELDLSRPRWRDDPSTLLRTVRSRLDDDAGGHREHLARLEGTAGQAAAGLEARAEGRLLGPVRTRIVRRLIGVYRGGIQLREHHKHGAALYFAAVRDVLAGAGESLAADGRLDRPEDVWYLRADELLDALDGGAIDADVGERRRTHERFAAMTPPPVLTSEGETFAATAAADGTAADALVGTPVSPGVVEGPARVVRDPAEESLERGEILVAPSTDVGWTPLFGNAAGLVMEVGGRMTHGALVAREYGIPAVVSVANATTDLRTGERVRVDGTRGTVERLDAPDESPSGGQ